MAVVCLRYLHLKVITSIIRSISSCCVKINGTHLMNMPILFHDKSMSIYEAESIMISRLINALLPFGKGYGVSKCENRTLTSSIIVHNSTTMAAELGI